MFEIVDFQSAYHAILGWPTYASFMARPCYVYLKMKTPGPRGVITVFGNHQRAQDCLQDGAKIADEHMVPRLELALVFLEEERVMQQ